MTLQQIKEKLEKYREYIADIQVLYCESEGEAEDSSVENSYQILRGLLMDDINHLIENGNPENINSREKKHFLSALNEILDKLQPKNKHGLNLDSCLINSIRAIDNQLAKI